MLSLRLPHLEWTDQQRKTYFAWFEEAKAYRGGESFDSFTKQIFDEAIEYLDEVTKQKLIPLLVDAPRREDSTSETIESGDVTSRPIIRK